MEGWREETGNSHTVRGTRYSVHGIDRPILMCRTYIHESGMGIATIIHECTFTIAEWTSYI